MDSMEFQEEFALVSQYNARKENGKLLKG